MLLSYSLVHGAACAPVMQCVCICLVLIFAGCLPFPLVIPVRCIGEYADLLASPAPALPALEDGAAACQAREAMPNEEVNFYAPRMFGVHIADVLYIF